MSISYINIYNNLINLTRNKNLYTGLKNDDTFSDRLIILLFHFGFVLKVYKSELSKKEAQSLFDFFVRQLELSIREIGYGDVSVNKKMKDYVNLFYSLLENIDKWETIDDTKKSKIFKNLLNIDDDSDVLVVYFNKFRIFLINNSFKIFTKDIIKLKF